MSEVDGRHIDDSDEIVRIIRAGREERAAHLDRVIAEGFLSPPASLPRKRVTAGALIRDEGGRVLLVESIHKRSWLTPGGTVEGNESPAQGAAREVREELGVRLPIGRALVMQWVQEEGDPDGALRFAYDGGVVNDSTIAKFRLPIRRCSFDAVARAAGDGGPSHGGARRPRERHVRRGRRVSSSMRAAHLHAW